MSQKKRRLPNFENCSVALFTTLALYGPVSARAQAPAVAPPARSAPAPAPGSTRPTAGTTLGAAASHQPIPPNRWSADELSGAFRKADVNGDGQLSRSEAAIWPGLARQFDQVDRNKDGSISSAEFDEALK